MKIKIEKLESGDIQIGFAPSGARKMKTVTLDESKLDTFLKLVATAKAANKILFELEYTEDG